MAKDSTTRGLRRSAGCRGRATAFPLFILGFTLFAASLSTACATSSSDASATESSSRYNTMSREQLAEIERAEDISLYDAIRRFHPTWLRGRGTTASVMVHYNGARLGGAGELRRFRVSDVQYVEHMEGPQATQRFGTGYGAGVLLVYGRAGT